jgi:hypothetical protein
MSELTTEAVAMQCCFAFGQGAGPDCDVDAATLGALHDRLKGVLKTVDLSRWPEDQTIAIGHWKGVGRCVAGSGRTDIDSVLDCLSEEIRGVMTPYCVAIRKVLGRP